MTDLEKLADLRTSVLCGGPGVEREVSLASGDTVFTTLRDAGFRVEKAVLPEEGFEAFLEDLDCQVAVMMLHGEFGEDGRPQAVLEKKGIAFTGSDSRTCSLAMNKNATKRLFRYTGIPTPDWALIDDPDHAPALIEDTGLTLPLVIKPNSRGSSVGVTIVRDVSEIPAAVEKALAVDSLALAEKFVAGREVTIGWLNGVFLPIIELAPDGAFYDYNAKYVSSKTEYRCPASLDDGAMSRIESVMERILQNLSLRDLARVDILIGSSGPQVLEINTSPGFTSHSLVPLAARQAGIGMKALCCSLVEMAARRGGLLEDVVAGGGADSFFAESTSVFPRQRTA